MQALQFHNCNGLQLSGLTHLNSPRNHISINGCNGVTFSHINISAPENSKNTDGIDISDSTQILIQDSYIGTGDDCVAINGGTSFINITNVTCGPGHGISVGSLGANGAHDTVEEVHVIDCTFVGTMNGARIKTWQGGSGYVRNITFEQITLSAVNNPIVIDQYYPNYLQEGSDIEVSDVKFIGVHGTSTAEDAITLKCSNSDRVAIFLILFMALLISSNGFDVLTYDAVGDGITDDSVAFLKAWAAVCGTDSSSTPILTVPSGMTFLLKPIQFNGPCKAYDITVEVSGNIVAPDSISEYEGHNDVWLSFNSIECLNINGTGQIDGRGSVWWPRSNEKSNHQRPKALQFHNCNGLQLSGLTHLNSPKNHIAINRCNGVIISQLNITAPKNSPNTDGIGISDSTQILIQDSYIGTGDDCVAINGGTSFINITNVTCGPGHGISVGSLGANGAHETVEEVYVKDCTFVGTMNGARIKTWQGGSGYARKITFEQIILSEVKNPIVIDQYYPNYLQVKGSDIEVSDVKFIGVQGTSTAENAITLKCSNSVGCTNIELTQINITSAVPGKVTSSLCINAHGIATDCNPPVECLT
ncbi:probable polygalacturonase At3g15720 [Telopea speciosissima]|uniref:probable polygalacturonase At3g15720 n=1 Tax=Telopea speciosissima TaxID=54955 RepID=UPI001CC65F2A|nr:probable polygalacturonase At3g15720 [Telopea speciosissima]